MLFQDALKRATGYGRKGEMIAVLPPYGGLPSRIAVRKEGLWISIVLSGAGAEFEPPGFLMSVADLQQVKGKIVGWTLERTIGIPVALQINTAGGSHKIGLTPLSQLSEWAPPWPGSQLKEAPMFGGVLEVLHAAVDDPNRPELGCVLLQPGLAMGKAFAGDEAQFAFAPTFPVEHETLIPAYAFQKWPDGPVRYHFAPIGANVGYFEIDCDELRVVPLPSATWWPAYVAEAVAKLSYPVVFDTPRRALLEPFKVARRIAERRLVAFGYSNRVPWLRIGDAVTTLPGEVQLLHGHGPGISTNWQVVLDGNRLQDLLKAFGVMDIRISIDPINPRAPVVFSHSGYFEALYPLLPMGLEKGA